MLVKWIEEIHSGQKGYRSECGGWYLGASPRKYYGIWRREEEGEGWRKVSGGYSNANTAKRIVEEELI